MKFTKDKAEGRMTYQEGVEKLIFVVNNLQQRVVKLEKGEKKCVECGK